MDNWVMDNWRWQQDENSYGQPKEETGLELSYDGQLIYGQLKVETGSELSYGQLKEETDEKLSYGQLKEETDENSLSYGWSRSGWCHRLTYQ